MTGDPHVAEIHEVAHTLLEQHWDEARGYCVPNPNVYPHLWLWDSCFHAIAWAATQDQRAVRELDAVLAGQLRDGLVPHMRYGGATPDTWLGPLPDTSSLTQPPMYGHAANILARAGMRPSDETLARCRRGLDWLWRQRRTDDGLIYIVHPWEAGNDHSPRWDDWGAPGRTPADWSRPARTAWNKQLVRAVTFGDDGAATWSRTFVTCPAGFNAYVAFNFAELAAVNGDAELIQRAEQLADAIDEHLWDPAEQLWQDRPVIGGGPSVTAPISDGLMAALVTSDAARAGAALAQLTEPARFGTPYGPANVARSHPSYDPVMYWRGPAWPVLNYLLWRALVRWGRTDQADQLARQTVAGAVTSGWAEYWNPENGDGLGATPQAWTAVVAAMT